MIQDYYTEGGTDQKQAITKLIEDLKAKNAGLEVMRNQRKSMRFGGERGESVFMEGASPIEGQKEYIWMVAAMRPQGLFHLLMISPQNEYDEYAKTFEKVVRSVDFDDKYKAPQPQAEAPPPPPASGAEPGAPEVVSGVFNGQGYSFDPPQGWRASRHQNSAGATIVPENGVVGQGIARGVIVDYFNAGRMSQADAVTKLIDDIRSKNPGVEPMSRLPARDELRGREWRERLSERAVADPGAERVHLASGRRDAQGAVPHAHDRPGERVQRPEPALRGCGPVDRAGVGRDLPPVGAS